MSRPTVLMPGRSSSRAARVMVVAAAVACPMAAVRGADVDVDDLRIEGPRVRFLVEDEESLPPAAGAGGGLLRFFRGFFNPPGNQPPGDPDVPDGADGPMPDDPEKAAAWQQRQQIRQQAAQMTQLFQPTLWAELELVRNACGDEALPAETRKQLLTAGRAALEQSALEFTRRQMNGGDAGLDPRRVIREAIARTVKAHVPAEARASYERQVALRSARRDRVARSRLVLVIDRQLELTPEQQARVGADLEAKWDAGWPWTVDGQGMQINGYRPAPDYAGACVTPHLDERQLAAWRKWCNAAGVRAHGLENWGQQWNFGGQGLEADAWWGK